MLKNGQPLDWKLLYKNEIDVFKRDKKVRPKTIGQRKFIEAVQENEIVFAILMSHD